MGSCCILYYDNNDIISVINSRLNYIEQSLGQYVYILQIVPEVIEVKLHEVENLSNHE